MNRLCMVIAGIAVGLTSLSVASPASAQASRTWVSGLGDDANPCSRTAPCKTFAGAISKTATGGEIDALDPGGFGAVTITKSMTIDGGGFVASALTSGGTNGIIINASSSSVVHLRNLQISSAGATPGSRGVWVTTNGAKSVTLTNVEITGLATCGVCVEPGSSQLRVVIDSSRILNGASDGVVVKPLTSGTASNRVIVRNSTITGNAGAGIRVGPASSSLSAYVLAFHNLIANNKDGILVDGAAASARISDNDITGNGTGLRILNSGKIYSFQNNSVDANSTDGVPTNTVDPR